MLATTAALLFFLPILSIPLAGVGGAIGVLAVFVGREGGQTLRWAVLGIVSSLSALAITLAIAFAISAEVPGRSVSRMWQTAPGRPYVPPPARPGALSDVKPDSKWRSRR